MSSRNTWIISQQNASITNITWTISTKATYSVLDVWIFTGRSGPLSTHLDFLIWPLIHRKLDHTVLIHLKRNITNLLAYQLEVCVPPFGNNFKIATICIFSLFYEMWYFLEPNICKIVVISKLLEIIEKWIWPP